MNSYGNLLVLGSLFGTTTTNTGTGLFGAKPQGSGGLFGASGTTTTGGLFGNSATGTTHQCY